MSDSVDPQIRFREIQRFRQAWMWVLFISGMLLVVVIFGYGMVTQFVYGRPWGDEPMSDTALIIAGLVSIVVAGGVALLFLCMALETKVADDGICIRFFPFVRKRIAYDQIISFEARTYRPIAEYGGWGIRVRLRGTAYNVSGNRGVQLELANGTRLLIGSQRPDELADAIQTMMPQSAKAMGDVESNQDSE